jgi:hypothetical protein
MGALGEREYRSPRIAGGAYVVVVEDELAQVRVPARFIGLDRGSLDSLRLGEGERV